MPVFHVRNKLAVQTILNMAQNYGRVFLKQTPLEPPLCVNSIEQSVIQKLLASFAMHSRAVERNEAAFFFAVRRKVQYWE